MAGYYSSSDDEYDPDPDEDDFQNFLNWHNHEDEDYVHDDVTDDGSLHLYDSDASTDGASTDDELDLGADHVSDVELCADHVFDLDPDHVFDVDLDLGHIAGLNAGIDFAAISSDADKSFETHISRSDARKAWNRLPRRIRTLLNCIRTSDITGISDIIDAIKPLIIPLNPLSPASAPNPLSPITPESGYGFPAPENYSFLQMAIERNNIDIALLILQLFLELGLDINACDGNGNTALHIAVSCGARRIIKELVNADADIHARNKKGATPFLISCKMSNWSIVRFLLEKGAYINDVDYIGRNCLHWVGYPHGYNDKTARKLLHRGANVHLQDVFGMTPLHALVNRSGHLTYMLDLFLGKGADINAISNEGKTPFDLALIHNDTNVPVELLKRGADINIGDTISILTSVRPFSETFQKILASIDIDVDSYDGFIALMCLQELITYHLLDCDSIIDIFQFSRDPVQDPVFA